MPSSEIDTIHRPGLPAKRSTPRRTQPRVHITIIHGADYEAKRWIALPKVEGDMPKTFRAALRTLPTLLTDMQYAVVIHGEDVVKYPGDVFRWLCGAGPDPAGKDPNWMGHPVGEAFMKGDGR